MLARHMAGYAPSLVLTAFLSFVSVTLFTSLMTQAEYGQYSLTISAMTMLGGVGFFWLQSASSRLLPQEVAAGQQDKFLATLYGIFLVSAIAMIVANMMIGAMVTAGDWTVALWCAVPLAILRALLTLNQSIHRNFVRIGRYNILEIGQGIIGFTVAMILVVCFHYAALGAAVGMMIGLAIMLLFDGRMFASIKISDFDKIKLKEIIHFGTPFVVTFGLSFVLSGSDRFLIEYFLGPDQVGIYSAGYAFPDRIGQNLFMAVATASFPLVVRRLEQDGMSAARAQTYTNGVAILALAFPACIGLLVVNRLIAATLIGPDFREGAVKIMPLIAIATIFNGVAAHYFDHAFHLAKRTRLFFFTLGPAALLNFIGNLYAIPHFGIIGAAYTTLAAYALYLTLSIIIGRRVFQIRFPFKPALKIAISTGAMAAVLLSFSVPENAAGLIVKIAVGAVTYGIGIFIFDVMGVRSRFFPPSPFYQSVTDKDSSALDYSVVTDEKIDALAPEWQALHRRVGSPLFGDYGLFRIWQRHLAEVENVQPYILTARTPSGELKGLLALDKHHVGFMDFVRWAGAGVFDYADILAEDVVCAEKLWNYAIAHHFFDVALVKDVRAQAVSFPILNATMHRRDTRRNYYVTLDGMSGEEWMAAQSRKLRGDTRRKTGKMQTQGDVAFHVYQQGDAVPEAVIDILFQQKSAWFRDKHGEGLFTIGHMKGFLHELATYAAQKKQLYLAWLSCGNAVAACHMGFVQGGVLYLYLTTYDAAFGVYSPGNHLMVETIKWAADHKMAEVDFMRGDENYKRRFATGWRELSDFILPCSTAGKFLLWARNFFYSSEKTAL